VAAGARLGQVVVDDDRIAARAIELLKSRRAGRLTFLPLNKIRAPGGGGSSAAFARGARPGGDSGAGLIGRAVELVRFEPVYDQVFAYVFGDTLVFSDLASARQQLGRSRAVTLAGELLAKSGAMTGGSFSQRSSSLSFGRSSDQDEAEPLRRRLLELGESLVACRREESKLAQLIEQQKPQLRELEKQQAALIAERNAARRNHAPLLERSRQRAERLSKLQQDQTEQQQRLEAISTALPPLTEELEALDEAERNSGNNDDAAAWAQLQTEQEAADQGLEAARRERDQLLNARRERQLAIERLGDQEKALAAEETRFADARRILDRVERITGKTPLLETARTDIKQALESVLHQHDSERSGEPSGSLEPVKVTLLTQLIDRDIAAARLTLRRLREELPNDDPFLVRAYRSFEDTYLRLAEETARKEGNGAALTLLQEGAGLIPGASRLQKAQQKYMSPGNAAGRRFRDCDTCPEMATLPMGSFRMGDLGGGGSEDERPVREVAIQYLLAVGIYEVTVAEYSAFQAAPAAPFPQSEDSPVVNVRWDEAVAYAEWLSAETGEPYRLLTEAEWEYAARAGTATKYAFGNTWNAEQANAYGDADGHQYAMAVGSFPANGFGLHDMHGNVWEWVSDCWNGGYRGAPTDGSSWDTGDCLRRVVRGGSWDSDRQYLRSSNRNRKNMTDRYSYVGFRVAKTLTPEPEAAP